MIDRLQYVSEYYYLSVIKFEVKLRVKSMKLLTTIMVGLKEGSVYGFTMCWRDDFGTNPRKSEKISNTQLYYAIKKYKHL